MKSFACLFLGLSTVDINYRLNAFPLPDSKNNSEAVEITAGGPALNAAAAFSHLGGKTKLISAVGSHQIAQIIFHDLKNLNIEVDDLSSNENSTPVISSIIISDEGKRTIITTKPEIKSSNKIDFENALRGFDALMVDGYYADATVEAAEIARKKNIPVILDGGSWKEKTEMILPFVTDAICSSKFFPPGLKDKSEIFNYLIESGIERAAITDGENPIEFRSAEDHGIILPPKIKAIDTSAAGDIFHGAYIYYYLKYSDLEKALKSASIIAAESCKYSGSRNWMKA